MFWAMRAYTTNGCCKVKTIQVHRHFGTRKLLSLFFSSPWSSHFIYLMFFISYNQRRSRNHWVSTVVLHGLHASTHLVAMAITNKLLNNRPTGLAHQWNRDSVTPRVLDTMDHVLGWVHMLLIHCLVNAIAPGSNSEVSKFPGSWGCALDKMLGNDFWKSFVLGNL